MLVDVVRSTIASDGRSPSIRWDLVLSRIGTSIVVGWFVVYALLLAGYYVGHPSSLFVDTTVYWRASEAWLRGGDPWAINYLGIPFAAPPPALLLNAPLVPFGPLSAALVWPILDVAGAVLIVRRLRLPPWWLLFPPFLEGMLAGSPDTALAALVLIGGGWLTVAFKPYAAPALLGARRFRSIAGATLLVLGTVILLPWAQFVQDWPVVSRALTDLTRALSAWGNPILMALCAVVLLLLPRRIAGELATPVLWPMTQLHYHVFSVWAASRSPILAIGLSLPIQLAPVWATLAYAALLIGQRAWFSQRQRAIPAMDEQPSGVMP